MTDTPQESGDEQAFEGKARRGALWVLLGYGGSQVLRLVGNLILTRLLFQEAFGIMALMATVLMGLELFSDVGIGPSIIQNDRRDRAFVNTAWTMQVGRGFIIYAIACAVALPFSWMYEEPSLAYLLPLVGLNAIAGGFNSTKIFTLNRDLSLGRIEIVIFGSQLLGLIVMVVWALIDRSVMALVAGSLATGFSKMLLTHFFLPGENNRFAWDKTALVELIRFGRWIFISTVLTFVAGQSDRLVFGKMVSLEELGVYYMGVVIAMLPAEALGKLSMQIIFPVYNKVRERDGDFKSVFESTRRSLMVVAGWAFAGLIAGGPAAVELLYDPRYAAAGWAVQMLSVGGWWLVVSNTYGAALFAAGVPKWTSLGSFGKVVSMGIAIPLGYWVGHHGIGGYGFHGAVAGFAISEVVRYIICAAASSHIGMPGFRQDGRLTFLVALSGGLGAVLEYMMRVWEWHIVVRCAAIAVFVTAFWVPLGWPLLRARLEERRLRKQGLESPEEA